jgi:hypothetical protein
MLSPYESMDTFGHHTQNTLYDPFAYQALDTFSSGTNATCRQFGMHSWTGILTALALDALFSGQVDPW